MSSQSTGSAYLDHAATTPMRPEAIAALTEELERLGNPSSLHAAGRRARRVVEESREQLAEVFGARPSEVVFTSGGTEADNLAVKGLYWARQDNGARRRVLTTSVEHHAVLDSVRWLEDTQGAEAIWLGVDTDGGVRPEALRSAVSRSADQVAVVSVMWANNEVGTVQPVAELAAVAHEYGIPFHTDAVQAAAQRGQPRGLLRPVLGTGGGRHREGPDRGGIQGPGPDVALLAAAVQHRHRSRAAGQDQRPDADRPAELVAGHGERVRAAGGEVDRELRGGLHRVGVERHAVLVCHRGQLLHRLDRAHLVVRPHHADHGDLLGGLPDRGAQGAGDDHAVVTDRQPGCLGALGLLQPPDRVQDGVMLDRGGQHPAPHVT